MKSSHRQKRGFQFYLLLSCLFCFIVLLIGYQYRVSQPDNADNIDDLDGELFRTNLLHLLVNVSPPSVHQKLVNRANFSSLDFQKILAQDAEDELRVLRPLLDSMYKDEHGRCPQKSSNITFVYEWKIKPTSCQNDVNMVVLVKSSIFRSSLRWTLRKTWAKDVSSEKIKTKHFFVIGSTDSSHQAPLIEQEAAKHDDILQGDFLDEYKSVSKKVFLGMRFIKTYCRNALLVTVADDDAMILPWNYFPLVFQMAEDPKGLQPFIAGISIHGAVAIRNKQDRWYVSEKEFSCPVYPDYYSGTLYTMSRPALHLLCALTRAYEPFFLDDVLFGTLTHLGHVIRKDLSESRFKYGCDVIFAPHSTAPSEEGYIGCHGADFAKDQEWMWHEFCSRPVSNDKTDLQLLSLYCSKLL